MTGKGRRSIEMTIGTIRDINSLRFLQLDLNLFGGLSVDARCNTNISFIGGRYYDYVCDRSSYSCDLASAILHSSPRAINKIITFIAIANNVK